MTGLFLPSTPLVARAAEPQGLYVMTHMIRGSSLELSGRYFKNGEVQSGTETGTYELSGTILTLKAANDKVRQVLTFPHDDGSKGPPPRRIFFDGAMLKRQ